MAFLEMIDVAKRFGRHTAVERFDLQMAEGELVSLLGGSGCGKTTTLRLVAGFEQPDRGRILIRDGDMVGVPTNRRDVGMVFQSYALFPNMSVRKNIGYGLRARGRHPREIERRVDEMLDVVHMAELADRYPHQLSGGQQQRVALARAIAVQPRVLLLDEPLSALDAKIRVRLRAEIRAIQRRLGITTLYVTHDQEEALSISDRIVVMNAGRVEQTGTPSDIYNRPATPFVASFIGSLSVLEALLLDPAEGTLSVAGQRIRTAGPLAGVEGQAVRLALRPEQASLRNGTESNNHLTGTLVNVAFLGAVVRLAVSVGGRELLVDTFNDPHQPLPRTGSTVTIGFPPEALRQLT